MNAYEAIVGKRDTREYIDTPVPQDVLARVLQAGRMAGSAKDLQPVRLVVLRDAERRRDAARCGRSTAPMLASPVAVVIVLMPEPDQPPGVHAYFRGPFDAGRAAQNIMVAARAEGLASCPITLHDNDCARQALGLPAECIVANVITLGYPPAGGARGRGDRRLPLDDYVHWERW